MNMFFATLAIKKLYIRPVETLVCILAFGLGMASLSVCWALLQSINLENHRFETGLAARSYVITPAEDNLFAMFNFGFAKAGLDQARRKRFGPQDLQAFQNRLAGVADAFFAEEHDLTTNADDALTPTTITEVSATYFGVVGLNLIAGRTLSDSEYATGAPLLVVTDTFAKRKFGSKNPLGQRLMYAYIPEGGSVRRMVLTVIGVFKNPGCLATGVVQFCLGDLASIGIVPFGSISTTAKNLVVVSPVGFQEATLNLLERMINTDNSGLAVMNNSVTLKRIRQEARSRSVISLFFASCGLIAAALTLGNMMYGWINSRKQLIATTKAIGARPAQVVLDYLIPAGAVAAAGALFGTALTLVFLLAIQSWSDPTSPPLHFDLVGTGVSFAITTTIALLAAAIPAFFASKIAPAEAIRA
jgi:putative ABC transport system permease protein